MSGKLYIVPTPIGNLEDITFRAIKILNSVDLIGAEDTRTSAKLLHHYEIKTQLESYHKFNEKQKTNRFIELLLKGSDIAIITDAGTPGISDPASIIIKEAIQHNIIVETLPGATAFVPALVNSGLDTNKFCFVGFLPDKKSNKETILNRIKSYPETLIFYEAPHRLIKFLSELYHFLGDRKISISREISKLYETTYRKKISELLENKETITLKGEFVIVVEGNNDTNQFSQKDLITLIQDSVSKGKKSKQIAKDLSAMTGINKNEIYTLILKLKNEE